MHPTCLIDSVGSWAAAVGLASARGVQPPSAGSCMSPPPAVPRTCPSTPRSTTTRLLSSINRRSRPTCEAGNPIVGHQRTGVYGNSKTIEWALHDGLGSYFWQHNWGSPGGRTHPAAHLHQVEIDKRHVGGVGVDINNICKPQFGQWA